LSSAIRKNIM